MNLILVGPRGSRNATIAPRPKRAQYIADERAAARRTFFGALHRMRTQLRRHGLTSDHVRHYYAQRFGATRMRECSSKDWAIAAAEVQAMTESPEILEARARQFQSILV